MLHYSSTQNPPNIDDEDEMDDNLQDGEVHVDLDCEGLVTTHFGKCTSDYCGDNRGKKEQRLSQIRDTLKAWAEASRARYETSNAKTEALLAKVERYKGRTSIEATSSSGAHEFSIIKCMPILEHIGLLNNDKYVKVVEKFMSVEWREFFMNMLDDRKKG